MSDAMMIDVASVQDDTRFTMRMVLLTLTIFTLPHLVTQGLLLQVSFSGVAVVFFTLLFVTAPRALPVCLIMAVADGGLELQLGSSTPKLFFPTIIVVAYVLSVIIRKTLGRRPAANGTDAQQPSDNRWVAILGLFYLLLLIPSLGQMQIAQRSLYLIIMRAVIFVGLVLFVRDRRIAVARHDVLFASALLGTIVAVAYVAIAIRTYSASTIAELTIGLSLKDNTVQVGILGTTNTIASFLAFTIPLTVALVLSPGPSSGMRAFGIPSVLIQTFSLLGTASRGGVASLFLAIVVAALVCHTSVAQLRRLVGFLVIVIAISMTAYWLAQEATKDVFAARLAGEAISSYALRRYALWLSSWHAFVDNPLFGIGIGNVGFYDRDFGTGDGSETHNLLLQTLAEEGFLAAIVIVLLFWKFVVPNISAARRSGGSQLWIVVGMFAALIDALVEPTFWQPAFATLFWFTAAYFYKTVREVPATTRVSRTVTRARVAAETAPAF